MLLRERGRANKHTKSIEMITLAHPIGIRGSVERENRGREPRGRVAHVSEDPVI